MEGVAQKVQNAVKPLTPTGAMAALPEVVVRLALGARATRAGNVVTVSFEDDPIEMHAADFEVALRVAGNVRSRLPDRITPGSIIRAVVVAQQAVAEELFRPGAVRVLFYSSLSKASSFYRCGMPAYALGMGSKAVAHISSGKFGRAALEYDVVVFQIDASQATQRFAKTLQEAGKRVVYEIDDAFDCLEPWHPQWVSYGQPERQGQIRAMMALADAVTVSTPWLRDRYAGGARRIEVVPNLLELAAWPPAARLRRDGLFKVVWAGSPSHSGDLEVVISPLGAFARAHEDVRIVLFGQEVWDKRIPKHQVETIPWCEFEEFPFRLAEIDADVAVAPLANVPFNWGKSNLRILQYWATGYPTVASRVGPYEDTIVHGENGALAACEADWVDFLEELYRDRKLRQTFAGDGLESVKTYDVVPNVARIESFYTSLAGR